MISLDDAKIFAKMSLANKLAETMERKAVNRSELAKKINRSKSFVTKILKGDANLTTETIVEVMHALDAVYMGITVPASVNEWDVYSQLVDVESSLWGRGSRVEGGGEKYLRAPIDADDNIVAINFITSTQRIATDESSTCAA